MFYSGNLENIKGQNGKVTPFARKKMRLVFDIVECKGFRKAGQLQEWKKT